MTQWLPAARALGIALLAFALVWPRQAVLRWVVATAGAGALFAAFQRLVTPAALDLSMGTLVVFMAVLGGTGAFLGPFLGSAVYTVFQDWLSKTTENWQFFIGLGFVLMILFAHTGLIGLVSRIGFLGRRAAARGGEVQEAA